MGKNLSKWYAVLMASAFLFCCAGCGRAEGERLKDYKVYRVEGSDSPELTQFLIGLAKQEAGVKLKNTADDGAAWISLLTEEPSAAEYGYTLREIPLDAFTIIRDGNRLFLLARTDEGMRRACRYLTGMLVDKEGILLLPDGGVYSDAGKKRMESVSVGTAPIEEYTILYEDKKIIPACEKLRDFIYQTGGGFLAIGALKDSDGRGIRLSIDSRLAEGEGRIQIEAGEISITGADIDSLWQEMYLFVNTYLGWMNAGEEDAHISSAARSIRIPADVKAAEEAWIEEREPIVTLWNVNYSGGAYLDGATSLKNNLMDYSEEQLYEYVKMMKFCGFTGIQVTDMCGAWVGMDNYEAVQERIRMMADAAHSLDMKFTLWVWGSCFNGFGWVDNTVSYAGTENGTAYDNPKTLAAFEKYYSIYAQLADCCDRVIGHYYDPGKLTASEDVAYFARMLKDKFRSVNPDIDFGVSCWVDAYSKEELVKAIGQDVTLYEGVFRDNEQDYAGFRQSVAELGTRLGTWAWNNCEMEIDQLAQMNFNMDIMRGVYQTARKYDSIQKPSYWSEMDSYHVLNAFSLYCAGQMLIDPDIASEELYSRLSYAVAGERYADAFAEVLRLIQDARSGSTWNEFLWISDDYVLKSDKYPAESILERCNAYIPVIQEMVDGHAEANTFPFPIAFEEVLRMMLPHLKQIQGFAQFRLSLKELEQRWRQGEPAEKLALTLKEIAEPIPNYNCVIGMWGQIEARAQRELVLGFCSQTGIEAPVYPEWDRRRKEFIYARTVSDQKGKDAPVNISSARYQAGLAYGEEELDRLLQEMVQEGWLMQDADGNLYLADWENYRYHFD